MRSTIKMDHCENVDKIHEYPKLSHFTMISNVVILLIDSLVCS